MDTEKLQLFKILVDRMPTDKAVEKTNEIYKKLNDAPVDETVSEDTEPKKQLLNE